MHDPRLEDHAVGLELQIVELVDQADRARVQGDTRLVSEIEAEITRLQEELAATAERVAQEPPDPHITARQAS